MLTKVFSKPILRLSVVIFVNENILRGTSVLGREIKQRNYARWSVRKPSKSFSPEEISSGSIKSDEFYKSEYEESVEQETPEPKSSKSENKLHSSEGQDYKVLEEHDYTFSKLMTQVGSRNMRRKKNLMMLEGKRLNLDAIEAGLKPKSIFFTRKSFLDELNLPPNSGVPLFKLPYKTVQLWSKLESPPGIIGFYGIPKEGDITTQDTIPVKVLCDNVRDPGNMGSIIRVAASVGCTELILMKGCTDPWDAKVLRAASGGHFHIPIKMDLTWSEHEEFLKPTDLVCLADNNAVSSHATKDNLPLQLYHEMHYESPSSIAVVIGGETEGLSYEAFSLASRYNGTRVYIPLSNCVESLNSGCALSVVLFEIKRQFLSQNFSTLGRAANLFRAKVEFHEQTDEEKEKSRSLSSGG